MDQFHPSMPRPLARAMRLWPRSGLRSGMEQIYAGLPATKCARKGACCGLLPPMQPVEMLAWLSELSREELETSSAEAVELVRHFLSNAARRLPCPWARKTSCARYERRFFGCRAYGLWSAKAFEPRRRQSLQAAGRVQLAWRNLGITLPPEVCAAPPVYCDKVEQVSGPAIEDAGLDALESGLAGLGAEKAWYGLLAPCGGDLSYLVAGLALGWQECLRAKVAMTRALLAGDAERAEDLLAQAEEEARAWARWIAKHPA